MQNDNLTFDELGEKCEFILSTYIDDQDVEINNTIYEEFKQFIFDNIDIMIEDRLQDFLSIYNDNQILDELYDE